MRILVTGSRDWYDSGAIYDALTRIVTDEPIVVVQGGARGADTIAAGIADNLGYEVETYKANWRRDGKSAGFLRNAHMVSLGADLCLAFIRNESRGATMCANLAERAGIPVRRFTY